MSDSQTLIHNALGDKYEIKELIQAGGMGKIFLGIHKALGKKVAIKIIHQELVKNEHFKARFYREAKLAASLDHPGIIDIYDFGTNDEFDYIIMPFIEGENFQARIKREGAFETKTALELMLEITEALGHAHQRKVIHRDIKPSNIMFDSRGKVVITDFGISKDLGDNDLTAPNTVLGSPRFMSPEQIKGDPVDARSDLYSLGLVFYEMVTGKHPFHGKDTSAIYYAQAHEIPARPEATTPDIPRQLGNIIMRLLDKVPENRYQSCEALLHDLQDFQTGKLQSPDQDQHPLQDLDDEKTILDDQTVIDSTILEEDRTILDSTGISQSREENQSDKKDQKLSPANLVDVLMNKKLLFLSTILVVSLVIVAILIPLGKQEEELATAEITQKTVPDAQVDHELSEQEPPLEIASLPEHSPQFDPDPVSPDPAPVQEKSLFDIILNIGNEQSSESFSVWTDKSSYRIGEPISFFFESTEPGYLTILTLTTKGEVIQVFPNYFSSSQFIQPGRRYSVPNEQMGFDLQVTGPAGTDKLVALISSRPFDLMGSSFSQTTPFLVVGPEDSKKSTQLISRLETLQNLNIEHTTTTYLIQQ
ncbi:serine/threonine-protein kinase [Desulfonatronovibrio magnus]|uniref:serine/threonine-protein kinase n=1 Tax=Desulfonatronovibrio magnus TaxID=698827 RepID=UPI000696D270|nr:serine/threonine-protein kinase [Desulfonatronovibrio magnus]